MLRWGEGTAGTALVGDLDGDGDSDLLVRRHHPHTNFETSKTSWVVYTNSGGVLTESWSFPWPDFGPGRPRSLGDATGDGLPDLLIVDQREIDVGGGVFESRFVMEIYRNAGGSFETIPIWTTIIPAGASPQDYAWGDVDGDGDNELAVAGAGGVKNGATPIPAGSIPLAFRGLVQSVKSFETLTVQAAIERRKDLVIQALINHPLVGDLERIEPLVDEMLRVHDLQYD